MRPLEPVQINKFVAPAIEYFSSLLDSPQRNHILVINFLEFGDDCLFGGLPEPGEVNHSKGSRDIPVHCEADHILDSSCRPPQMMFSSDVAAFQIDTPTPALRAHSELTLGRISCWRDRRTDLVHLLYDLRYKVSRKSSPPIRVPSPDDFMRSHVKHMRRQPYASRFCRGRFVRYPCYHSHCIIFKSSRSDEFSPRRNLRNKCL
jgi:hypothetical protein